MLEKGNDLDLTSPFQSIRASPRGTVLDPTDMEWESQVLVCLRRREFNFGRYRKMEISMIEEPSRRGKDEAVRQHNLISVLPDNHFGSSEDLAQSKMFGRHTVFRINRFGQYQSYV